MKLVIAIIQPPKLNAVREALEKVEVMRMTICDAQGFGTTTLLRKVVIEVMVNDDFLERTIDAIVGVARTGSEGGIGDGKIFVLPAEETVLVSDGSRGPGAV